MDKVLREQLRKVLGWGEAHADWKSSIDGLSKSKRGVRPPGAPHSAWELLEHMRMGSGTSLISVSIRNMFRQNGRPVIGQRPRSHLTMPRGSSRWKRFKR